MKVTCKKCDGKGWYTVRDLHKWDDIDCRECKGTGQVEEKK